MKRLLVGLFAISLLSAVSVFSQGKEDKKEEVMPEKIEMKMLEQNIGNLRSQEIVVQVLANQYNKELAELRKMEAVFCDVYKLDVNLWRTGKYVWDQEVSNFVEVKEEAKDKTKE
ncbi:hypothetical protein KKC59_00140 [bacterium]|nr:hypothetical protein [bacterium]